MNKQKGPRISRGGEGACVSYNQQINNLMIFVKTTSMPFCDNLNRINKLTHCLN